jgi:hypothetical protein
MNSTLKVQTLETSLIEKIKAELKKRAEAKTKRMLLKRPKRLAKRSVNQLVGIITLLDLTRAQTRVSFDRLGFRFL